MKKIFVVFFVLVTCGLCALNNAFLTNLINIDQGAEFCFFTTKQPVVQGVSMQKNGDMWIVFCGGDEAENVYKKLGGCVGYSATFKNEKALEDLLKNIYVLRTQTVDGIENIYGTTNGALFFSCLGGQKVNVQIAKTSHGVVVGCPMILGSY